MPGTPRHFSRFAAIDWSGARGRSHPGIQLAVCDLGNAAPVLIPPPGRGWARSDIADWVMERADEPMLIGFDFSFSAPFMARGAHLPGETLGDTARALWAHVDAASDDPDLGAAAFVDARRGRHFYLGATDGAKADFLHWRTCEVAHDGSTKPSTVYDAVGAAQVAKASFAGMRLLHRIDGQVPIWPFDPAPDRGACVVELYTAIAARAAGVARGRSKLRDGGALDAALLALGSRAHAPLDRYSDHATDALLAAAWLRQAAGNPALWQPEAMTPDIARSEGWTFGIA